jgi:histidinol-phosphate/aromatic aminotransferase/cobyric acid decarboxylase-like protein
MINLQHAQLRTLPHFIETVIPKDIQNYPNLTLKNKLIEKLAEYHNIRSDQIVLGNGSAELIDAITACFGDKTIIFPPTFFCINFMLRNTRLNLQLFLKVIIKVFQI